MKLQNLIFIVLFSLIRTSAFCQDTTVVDLIRTKPDSIIRILSDFGDQIRKNEIRMTASEAMQFLQKKLQPQIWKNTHDLLRESIERLINEASSVPFDSVESYLRSYPYDSLNFKSRQQIRKLSADSSLTQSDSLKMIADTTGKPLNLLPANPDWFPFISYENEYQGDSTRAAVISLLEYLGDRDSSIVNFTGLGDKVIPVWLNSRSGKMHRYWLKSDMNDSVTVWIGAHSKDTIGLYLEHGVRFARPVGQEFHSDVKIEMEQIDRTTLLKARRIIVKPELWKYRTEASFALNQASLTNWVKGGESSISTTLDITGYADYNNKPYKITSSNFARLKYGLIATSANGLRTNLDLLETNSKVNHKAFGKFDFSAVMLFKTQLTRGYKYTDSSKIIVSKFLNPGILTLGFGLDYKPNKKTSINFSPLSYKATFVPDTGRIDQTIYGITADRRSKHEPGMSFLISNEYKPFKNVTMTNRLQLFTNYTHNPQNIDVDWEMILTASLNWFTDVRVNTHLIFDDDTKTVEYDKENKPVPGSDGKPKKTARIQFKELLGFSFIFRF
ncbi:MAG TPA: DUF3078 domain-containing protein [Bacteroidales bacterium]|nr:DUF3078 domain-containing protein [Bacteroidales bacterium]OQB63689.1 MAG: hypothetical protein BWX96_00970 [Bacteroidetes bacterium ADurb.Bin145]HQG62376.1 DUF3078 domain-containing protein [Bacteroidales bacterium]